MFILFRKAWWSSAGYEQSPKFFAWAVSLYAVLIICVPFLFGVWGRMWNSIVLGPDNCLPGQTIFIKCCRSNFSFKSNINFIESNSLLQFALFWQEDEPD